MALDEGKGPHAKPIPELGHSRSPINSELAVCTAAWRLGPHSLENILIVHPRGFPGRPALLSPGTRCL